MWASRVLAERVLSGLPTGRGSHWLGPVEQETKEGSSLSESHYAAASRLIRDAGSNPGPKGMFILAAAGTHAVLALADGLTALGKAAVLLVEPASAPGHEEKLAALADGLARGDVSEVDPAGSLAVLMEEQNTERMERHEAARVEAEEHSE